MNDLVVVLYCLVVVVVVAGGVSGGRGFKGSKERLTGKGVERETQILNDVNFGIIWTLY